MAKPAPDHAAWLPAKYDLADVFAIKGVVAGTANADQQTRAMRWIINVLCGTYDLSFRPESDRETSFAEGKRYAGLQLVKLINLSGKEVDAMRKKA